MVSLSRVRWPVLLARSASAAEAWHGVVQAWQLLCACGRCRCPRVHGAPAGSPCEQPTLQQLLTHTSGLWDSQS